MKKWIILGLFVCAGCLNSFAQIERKTDSLPGAQRPAKESTKAAFKKMNLSKEQRQQLKEGRQATKAQIEAINNNDALSETQKQEQVKAIQLTQKEKMKALLNDEQKKQWQQQSKDAMENSKVQEQSTTKQKEQRKEMYRAMNLSAEQKQQLKAQQTGNKAKIEAIKANTQLTEVQKKDQIKDVLQNAKANQKKILSPEQQASMHKYKKERRAGGGKKRAMQNSNP